MRKKLLWIPFIWLCIVGSSPWVVHISRDIYSVTGWLAIGNYAFNLIDGLQRSFLYFILTLPTIFAVCAAFPRSSHKEKYNSLQKIKYRSPLNMILLMMTFFNIAAFSYNLGITGVETDTGGWRLSGIAHYIRSYIFLVILSFYIFKSPQPSVLIIIIYAYIAGLTAGSRFVIVSPMIILLLKDFISFNSKKRQLFLIIAIFFGYTLVTASRLVLFADNYEFSAILNIMQRTNFDIWELTVRGFNELFLRLGIGRDVILALEVLERKTCSDFVGLFFGKGSCEIGKLHFYGFESSSARFGLDPPAIASLVASLSIPFWSILINLGYAFWAYILCSIPNLLSNLSIGRYIVLPMYYMQVIFIIIGPIRFAVNIAIVLCILGGAVALIRASQRHNQSKIN